MTLKWLFKVIVAYSDGIQAIRRQQGPKALFPLTELTATVSTNTCWRVMETGHPPTRAVNSGRQLG